MKWKNNMKMKNKVLNAKTSGKLGVLLPGLGAIATTYIAGVIATNKGIGKPIGSFTQNNRIRLGKRTENRNPVVADFVPLANLNDLVLGVGIFLKTTPMKLQKMQGSLKMNS